MKKNLKNKLMPAVLLASLSGCGSLDYKQGTSFSDADFAGLQEGQTTTVQVSATYGAPQQTIAEGQNTIYVYRYSVIGGVPWRPNSSKSVSLTFNPKGVLVSKSQHASDTAGSNPLTQ